MPVLCIHATVLKSAFAITRMREMPREKHVRVTVPVFIPGRNRKTERYLSVFEIKPGGEVQELPRVRAETIPGSRPHRAHAGRKH